MNKKNILFLKISLILIAVATFLLCIFWLPGLAERTAIANPEYAYLKYPILIMVYITAIPFYTAFYNAYGILNNIKSGEVFTQKPVGSLKTIRNCAISELMIYIILSAFLFFQNALHPGIAIAFAIIQFTALIIAVFAGVLIELLNKAIELKDDNDLTI